MTWVETIILAVVQGLTEFLPVSSSGHLFLLEKLFAIEGDLLLYNVVLHLASMLAVVIVLWADVVDIFENKKIFFLLIIVSLPAFVFGYLIKDYFEAIGDSYLVIAIGLWLTSFIVYLIDRMGGKDDYEKLSYKKSLLIGLMQALAIMPGISRSGSTILGGRLVGLGKAPAVKFAFLMSLPVIMAAAGLELIDLFLAGEVVVGVNSQILVGFMVCLAVSYLVVKWFVEMIKKIDLRYFSLYTFILGLVVLVYYFIV